MKTVNLSLRGGLSNRIKPLASTFLFPDYKFNVYWHNVLDWHDTNNNITHLPFHGQLSDYFLNVWPGCKINYNFVDYLTDARQQDVSTWRFLVKEGMPPVDMSYPKKSELFDCFKQLKIAHYIKQAVKLFDMPSHALGVQIRRDHPHCGRIPFENYIEAIKKHGNVPIFLVTDKQSVLNAMILEFPKRVIYYPKLWSIESTMQMRSNLIEMLLLSETKNCLLSKYSTYGECAYFFAGGRMKAEIIS